MRISRISSCWTREMLSLLTRSSRIPTSKGRSVWRNRKLRKRIGFFEEDRSLTWFTTTSESLTLMISFLIMPIYSLSLFVTTMFRTSIRDGMKFYYLWSRSRRMMLWKVCAKWDYAGSDQLKTVLGLYDMEIHLKISMPNYQKLKTMVKRSINQKFRLRNFDVRNEKTETSRTGWDDMERGKGIYYQWRAKGQCSRGDQCSFRHESHDRAKPTPKAAPSSESPTSRGASEAEASLGKPCENFLKGTCTKLPCDLWHPSECQFF